MRQFGRRDFLRVTAGALAVGALSSCAPKVVEKIVKETVEVEKVVKETVEVEKVVKETVEVEKIVKETVVVKEAPLSRIARLDGKEAVLWGLQYDPHVEAYNRMAAYFKGLTGATIKVEPQGWPLETKLIAALAAGTQPDVACVTCTAAIPLHVQGVLLALDELVYEAMDVVPMEVFAQDAAEAFTWQGKMYGVPFEAGGSLGTMVNVPVEDVEKVGLADKYPPTNGEFWFESYESMWQLAKTLQDELGMEGDRVARWGLSSKGWDTNSYVGILRTLLDPKGMDWWDLGQQKFNIATDEGVEAMRLFVETPVKMGIETEMDQSHVDACLAGKVFLGRGNVHPILEGRALGFPYDPAGAPKIGGEPPLGVGEAGWGYMTPKTANNMEVAVEFLKMMVTDEGQWEMAHIYGGTGSSAWKALYGKWDYFTREISDAERMYIAIRWDEILGKSRYWGEAFGYFSKIEEAFNQVCSEVRQGNMGSEEACQIAQDRCEAQHNQWLEDVEEMKG